MDFNPDEFLKEAAPTEAPTGFDPDAFLAAGSDPQALADAEIAKENKLQAEHGSLGAEVGTALEGAAKTTTFGLSSGAEKYVGEKLGIDALSPENQRAREEANPISATIGGIGGLLSPTGIEGKIATKVGTAVAEKIVPHAIEQGILKGVSRSAVKYATEAALIQGGDETSKMMLNDPNQTLGTAISNIGLAAVLGGGLGVAGGLTKELTPKLAKIGEDFKGRMGWLRGGEEAAIGGAEALPARSGIDPFTKKAIDLPSGPAPVKQSNFDPFTKQPIEAAPSAPVSPIKPIPEPEAPSHLTEGAKIADRFVKQALERQSGAMLGSTLGATLGAATGIPGAAQIGSMLGHHLGSKLDAPLQSIAKPLLEKAFNSEELHKAIQYAQEVIKGEKLTNLAVKSAISASDTFPERLHVTDKQREKLEKHISEFQVNPEAVTNIPTPGHYIPESSVAVGNTVHAISTLLNQVKPQETARQAPLDPKPVQNSTQKAQYQRILDIAQQPLTTLKYIKEGSITSQDVLTLKAIYPEMYASLSSKLMNQVIEMTSKEELIPYDKVMSLSTFLQTPLESSLQPLAIAAAQPSPEQALQRSNSPSGGSLPFTKGNSMLKTSKSSLTPLQASQSGKTMGDKG